MEPPQVQLVFFGEVLDGFDPSEVRRELGARLNLDPRKVARLFSGARVILKRSIDPEKAKRYVAKFASLGAQVHVEAAPVPSATGAAPTEPAAMSVTPAVPAPAPAVLPAVGAPRRRRRTLQPAPGRTPPPPPSVFGLGIRGRLAPRPYAAAMSATVAAAALVALLTLEFARASGQTFIAAVVGALLLAPVLLFAWRLTVLRCHDCRLKGWWALVLAVPALGVVGCVALAVKPGSENDNRYGRRPEPGSALLLLVTLATLLLAAGLGLRPALAVAEAAHARPALPPLATLARASHGPLHPLSGEPAKAYAEQYASAPGHKAFAISPGGGMGWKTGAASADEAVNLALSSCEINRRRYAPPCETVSVDGEWVD